MRKLACFLLLLPLLCQSVFAQNFNSFDSLANPGLTDDFLPVEQAYQVQIDVQPQLLTFHWSIHPGYYLYRDRFKFAAKSADTELGEPVFSDGLRKWDDIFNKEMEVYYETSTVQVPLSGSNQKVVLRIESQGCADAGLCYPPRAQWIEADLESGVATVSSKAPKGVAKTDSAASGPGSNGETDLSLMAILLFALLGGVILNLMPCVFPVLSIKALSFTRAHHSSHGKHMHGIAYTAGVVAAFLAIAAAMLALRSAGEAVGWGFQLQSPLLVSFLIYLFFVMGLSFSGFFEFGAGLMSLGQNNHREESLPGSFMTGVLATTVASPCTAPFMGTAIGFTTTQPAAVSLLVFGFLGLGMALPFILLAWIPGLAEKLPKPGAWMETFKQFLAYPLYLAAVWLLWVAGRQTSIDVAAALVVGLTLLAMGIWLWGMRPGTLGAPSKWLAAAVLLLALALPQLAIEHSQEEPEWLDYSPELVADLRQQGKPVFINLTADWCITCLINERNALSSDAFHQELADKGVTYIKGDWTNSDERITKLLNRYRRNGVPLYLMYPAGNGDAEILPQILTESIVLEALARGTGS